MRGTLLLNKERRDLAEPIGILLLHFKIESYIIFVYVWTVDNSNNQAEAIDDDF